ncbi:MULTISPECIES: EscU/YscU/HrcU family type III secretion system export apparatus switch protein [Microbacterium]|uniref:EscU/YscU/HrcU family type III secretion system export apparatus switch protein n=1 Tax=Microbacterium TaxID=33882 RepID=UPI00214B0317|nr:MULTISPECIES: EscU/YscU/HrcU family type III secretion system export apparatus switch protein [unclassified Microbacterium]MCR2813995.1 EscU/YscU/HrcU family type III secretion system export apparatus switch protein [Microbacterium sp. zg.Y1084]MDL5487186.1 EscU/YscU/HrcU family type III secretion system export apparatus switch protein [Microbacterium sp. zg-Y1211]
MSGSGSDSGERTEKATDRRLREARRKGKLTRSQDFTAWLGIAAAAAMMATAIGAGADAGGQQFVAIVSIIRNPAPQDAVAVLQAGLASIPGILGGLLAVVAIVTLIAAIAQGGVHLRGIPSRFEQFNVVSGVKRLFGMQALWEGVKALLKTVAIGLGLYLIISGLVPVLTATGTHSVSRLLEIAASGTASLLITAVAVGIALAAVDVLVVIRRNRKHTRMTKKEARDEHKRSEGDPLIRGQRRARQLALSRNRMIAAVGDADVVLVNPTHVAVALRYEPGKSAPRVVAKGSGLIAERIRDRAAEAGVPMVRDIPLARAVHGACELGQEIPADLYTAVARVLVFVDGLKRRGAARGVHTLPQRKSP